MNPLISIIIPVYNASEFIENTIESILNQSFTNYEIVIIDDGSKDNSYQICKKYQESNDKILFLHQANKGVNEARKNGINNSKGEYILFCDADDLLPKDALQIYYNNCNQVDAVIAYDDDPNTIPNKKSQIIDGHTLINRFLTRKNNPDIAAKLWKRKLFTENSMDIPPFITLGEDLIMNLRLALNADRIMIIYKCTYIYTQHEMQTTKRHNYTLDYEKLLYNYILISLSNHKSDYKKYLCQYRLKRLRNLARFGFYYDTNDIFISQTCKEALKYIQPLDNYIYVLFYKYPFICCKLLRITAKIKRSIFGIYH